ncbi:uncharacterized protein MCYG_03646 [Microsporum canis CBS 113480]|uniref:Uncharacterized protein n=1 Tax=Arthroderma otae (strain ATCC MYA-4605 / CBS 113480) TaxID=554155 RepID=C5FJG6_ARTOC|nr:uncharacterized protein MCYG_03646 [Microsporum canis CBS 113480]EEQ30827.1 predicted protein [Microsporum canis CBS 113480]
MPLLGKFASFRDGKKLLRSTSLKRNNRKSHDTLIDRPLLLDALVSCLYQRFTRSPGASPTPTRRAGRWTEVSTQQAYIHTLKPCRGEARHLSLKKTGCMMIASAASKGIGSKNLYVINITTSFPTS